MIRLERMDFSNLIFAEMIGLIDVGNQFFEGELPKASVSELIDFFNQEGRFTDLEREAIFAHYRLDNRLRSLSWTTKVLPELFAMAVAAVHRKTNLAGFLALYQITELDHRLIFSEQRYLETVIAHLTKLISYYEKELRNESQRFAELCQGRYPSLTDDSSDRSHANFLAEKENELMSLRRRLNKILRDLGKTT